MDDSKAISVMSDNDEMPADYSDACSDIDLEVIAKPKDAKTLAYEQNTTTEDPFTILKTTTEPTLVKESTSDTQTVTLDSNEIQVTENEQNIEVDLMLRQFNEGSITTTIPKIFTKLEEEKTSSTSKEVAISAAKEEEFSEHEIEPDGDAIEKLLQEIEDGILINLSPNKNMSKESEGQKSPAKASQPLEEKPTSSTAAANLQTEEKRVTSDLIEAKTEASSTSTENEAYEERIQRIVDEIEEGGLMLVSSLDPRDPDNLINEIYMIDKNTGDLCDKPLDLPKDIIQAIIELAT